MHRLRYLWLLFGKIAALAFIFVGGCLLATLVLPMMALFPSQQKERVQFLIHNLFRIYLKTIHFCRFIRLEIHGTEKIAACRGKIVIANHPSLLDVVILMALVPRTQCIVKHELWTHPLLGRLMRLAGYIRNNLVG